ncbi:MAG: hypothetical protein K0B16_06975 [Burkholderiaceae bacterium]|nr:hypothetical protein [Burkholderiaceae bacterium]
MLRSEWKFTYPAARLAEAALAKFTYHDERHAWWSEKRHEVMATIRSEGIEVDERMVLAHTNPKAQDWDRGTRVMVRNDLQENLAECMQKLRHHTALRRDYDGWIQALQANATAHMELDIDDYLFFFGRN